jgi:hypothetical protein
MTKRIIAFVLCILTLVSILPPRVYATSDYDSHVGMYAHLNSYYEDSVVFVHDGSKDFAMTDVLVYDYADFEEDLIFRITDWYLDSVNSALWYQVEAYRGDLPADMPAGYWIFQNYTDDGSEENYLIFVAVEPEQGETTVTVEGIPASEYTMEKYEKPMLEASSTLSGAVSYRWQILADRDADLWVDIHGQNDGRQLMDERRHREYLDRFGVPEEALSAYKAAWDKFVSIRNELSKLEMDEVEKESASCTRTLCIAVNYGGRAEVVDAVNKLIASGKTAITEDDITQNIYSGVVSPPDAIVRTGGEVRLSNFLMWQSAYSELFFTDTFFGWVVIFAGVPL